MQGAVYSMMFDECSQIMRFTEVSIHLWPQQATALDTGDVIQTKPGLQKQISPLPSNRVPLTQSLLSSQRRNLAWHWLHTKPIFKWRPLHANLHMLLHAVLAFPLTIRSKPNIGQDKPWGWRISTAIIRAKQDLLTPICVMLGCITSLVHKIPGRAVN